MIPRGRCLFPVAALLLALGCGDTPGRSGEDGPGGDPTGPGAPRIERTADRYELRVTGAAVGDVLDRLAEAGHFAVEAPGARPGWRERRVTLALDGVALEHALHSVLAEVPHHLHYEWVSGAEPGGPPWPEAPVHLARVTVGPLYRQPPWRDPGARASARRRTTPETRGDGLEDRDPEVRARAARVVEPSGSGLATLGDTLRNDPSPAVRQSAARALAGGRGLHTYPILLDGLEDADPEVVVTVIESLEDAYDDHPVPEIRERVAESAQHRDARIRAAAQDFLDWVEE